MPAIFAAAEGLFTRGSLIFFIWVGSESQAHERPQRHFGRIYQNRKRSPEDCLSYKTHWRADSADAM